MLKTKFINSRIHKNETLLPQIRFLTHEGLAFHRDMYRVFKSEDQKKKEEILKLTKFNKK